MERPISAHENREVRVLRSLEQAAGRMLELVTPDDIGAYDATLSLDESGHTTICLALRNCQLPTLPDAIDAFQHMQRLHLQGNSLTKLPEPSVGLPICRCST